MNGKLEENVVSFHFFVRFSHSVDTTNPLHAGSLLPYWMLLFLPLDQPIDRDCSHFP